MKKNDYYITKYDESWTNAIYRKKAIYNDLFHNQLTIEIPVANLEDEKYHNLIKFLPNNLLLNNKIKEDGKYFYINGKKCRKLAFLQEYFTDQHLKENLDIHTTTGKLYLTIDPNWFIKCSDDEMTSWYSCFAPDGEFFFCPYEYATSDSILMAMILNDDKSKIIGRKWVVIPECNYIIADELKQYFCNNELFKLILFLRSYGTFPIEYQRSLSEFIITNLFHEKKDDYHIFSNSKDELSVREIEAHIYIEGQTEGGDYQSFNTGRVARNLYFEAAEYIAIKKNLDLNAIELKPIVQFEGPPLDEDDLYYQDRVPHCERCGEELYGYTYDVYVNDTDTERWCENCTSGYAAIDEYIDSLVDRETLLDYGFAIEVLFYHFGSDILESMYTIAKPENIKYLIEVRIPKEGRTVYVDVSEDNMPDFIHLNTDEHVPYYYMDKDDYYDRYDT